MKSKKDSPGVYFPPPLFHVLAFLAAIYVQKRFPIDDSLFLLLSLKLVGVIFLFISLFFLISSLRQFYKSKNTLILIKPSSTLQTNGIFKISRNPMYVALAFVYLGISCLIGNWWNIIFFPFILLIFQEYVIKREEKYLERAFGKEYLDYKDSVRRWL